MIENLATNALRKWPLTVNTVTLAAHRENAVFCVQANEGRFALRLHRAGYRSDAELESELLFSAALANAGISVPKPVKSRVGLHVEHEDGTQVSVLTWLAGRPLGQSGVPLDVPDRCGTFRRLGYLIATLHTSADNWKQPPGFTRQPWGLEGLLGDNPQWGRFWDNPKLSREEKTVLGEARRLLRHRLAAMSLDTGLIHADVVSENILIDGETLSIIDFDDSGWGYRLQDIATALVKHEAEPDFADLKQALIAGYTKRRSLQVGDIDTFLFIRHLSYVGWIVSRMAGPDSETRCARFISNAVSKARDYIERAGCAW
jgi:Ser/Thr protein kinase RdoA (MazF antagonist)